MICEKKFTNIKSNGLLGHIVALVVVMIWGGTFVNTRVLIDKGLSPEEIYVLRTLLAYVCIWFISPKKLFCDSLKDELIVFLLGIFGSSLYFLTENYALKLAVVNDVSFIVCTIPLVTTVLALLFLKSVKASLPLVAGSVFALLGVALVIFNGHFVLHLDPLGDFLALAAATSWAIYSLVMKNFSSHYSPFFITRKVFFYGLITITPVFAVHPWAFPFEQLFTPVIGLNLLYLGVIASFVCFAAWAWVISRLGALRASNYIYFNPVTTVIMSALVLNEHMTPIAYVGSAMILVGVFVANKAKGI
ncbi:EamA family transporter [Prevotella intermedia]|uniref:EamA family transporter n=1 Tax=Prevotella intermedia TaxID=28131 RepID=A0AAJ3RUS2_PREIN|nr:DMT family transporter [Prevotella intermedia]ATV54138.1 EamA family transporter [Prevotella intermedia]PJI20873.1 EamA family transporter [Prevotella intermedia]